MRPIGDVQDLFRSQEIPSDALILLTVRDLSETSSLFAMDFRDIHAIFCKSFPLGINISGEIRFGSKPFEMVNGIWIMPTSHQAQARYPNYQPTMTDLTLEIIT